MLIIIETVNIKFISLCILCLNISMKYTVYNFNKIISFHGKRPSEIRQLGRSPKLIKRYLARNASTSVHVFPSIIEISSLFIPKTLKFTDLNMYNIINILQAVRRKSKNSSKKGRFSNCACVSTIWGAICVSIISLSSTVFCSNLDTS